MPLLFSKAVSQPEQCRMENGQWLMPGMLSQSMSSVPTYNSISPALPGAIPDRFPKLDSICHNEAVMNLLRVDHLKQLGINHGGSSELPPSDQPNGLPAKWSKVPHLIQRSLTPILTWIPGRVSWRKQHWAPTHLPQALMLWWLKQQNKSLGLCFWSQLIQSHLPNWNSLP